MHFFQEPIVSFCDANFLVDDLLDLVALDDAHRRLITGQAIIVTGELMSKAWSRERKIPQQLQFFCQLRIVGHNHSAFAGGDHFIDVKAETTHLAETAGYSSATSCAVRFGAIFDHNQVMFLRDLAKPIHVHRMTEEVNRNDCARARSD